MHETSLNSYLHFEYVTGQPPKPLILTLLSDKKGLAFVSTDQLMFQMLSINDLL